MRIRKFLGLHHGYLKTVYFDWGAFLHNSLANVHSFAMSHCCNTVYVQHGGGNFCKQNDFTVTPCVVVVGGSGG